MPPPRRARPTPPGRWRLALTALFLLALFWRLAYLGRLAASPLGDSLTADARAYWGWAEFLLRTGPIGKNPFFLAPIYPYVLWPIRASFGNSIGAVLVIQALWGAAAAVLLADATRRLTRTSLGLIAGVIVALFETAVFFDGLLLMESLLFALEALLIWLAVTADRSPRRVPWVAAIGIAIGLLAEGRPTSVLLLAAAWAVLVFRREGSRRALVTETAALLGGCALVVIPFAA